MEEKKNYNVLKLVAHGSRCYVSADYIRGKPLIQWLKYHPSISKEQLNQWMLEIVQNLEYFHRCQGNPSYQYVNPYSIIVSEERKLFLLNVGGKNHEDILYQMQRRNVREHFLSPKNQYYQRPSIGEDIYGLGKTLQYLIASVDVEPHLSRFEERKLQKIISKCLEQNSKKSYQNVREILEHFPRNKESRKIKNWNERGRKKVAYAGALLLLLSLSVWLILDRFSQNEKELAENELQEQEVEWQEMQLQEMQLQESLMKEENKALIYDLAWIYFLEFENYEKIRELFEKLEEDELAQNYVLLAEHLLNENLTEQELQELLLIMEEQIPDVEDTRYYLSLLEGYDFLRTEEAQANVIRLCEMCLAEQEVEDIENWDEKKVELKERLAMAYERTGELEMALALRQELEKTQQENNIQPEEETVSEGAE